MKNDYKFNKAVLLTRKYLDKGIKKKKMIRLIELIQELIKQDKENKIIVFSQFRDTTKTIYENCEIIRIIPNYI